MGYFVNFNIAGRPCSIRSSDIDKVIRVVEIVPLPGASNKISGTINMHGSMIVVFNMQAIFSGTSREIELSDVIIVIRLNNDKNFGLLVDGIQGIQERAEEDITPYDDILFKVHGTNGLSTFSDGTILISEMETFLEAATSDLQKVS